MQIWDREGRMVYERQLDDPVRNWGIFENQFVFQEEGKPCNIFLLQLRNGNPATLYKFKLKSDALKAS